LVEFKRRRLDRSFLPLNSSVRTTFEFHPPQESHGGTSTEKFAPVCRFPYMAPYPLSGGIRSSTQGNTREAHGLEVHLAHNSATWDRWLPESPRGPVEVAPYELQMEKSPSHPRGVPI